MRPFFRFPLVAVFASVALFTPPAGAETTTRNIPIPVGTGTDGCSTHFPVTTSCVGTVDRAALQVGRSTIDFDASTPLDGLVPGTAAGGGLSHFRFVDAAPVDGALAYSIDLLVHRAQSSLTDMVGLVQGQRQWAFIQMQLASSGRDVYMTFLPTANGQPWPSGAQVRITLPVPESRVSGARQVDFWVGAGGSFGDPAPLGGKANVHLDVEIVRITAETTR